MAVHHRHVGRPVPRAEGRDKVSGRATYAGDVTLPGMLWGKALRSPVPHGRIKRIDTSRAEHLEGVKAVVVGRELRGRRIGRRIRDMPILADDVVRFAGEKVAAVAAATQQAAREAIDLIDVEYEELEPVLDPLEAMELSAALIHPEVMSYEGLPDPLTAPTNTFVHVRWAKGDVAQGFRQSELIVERTYRTQLVHQGYIEPHTCVVKALPDAGAEIWACSKTPLALRRQVSAALDAPFDGLLVHPCAIGGDFGGKGDFMDVALCCVLSRRSGRPVKMIMDSGEEFVAGNPRHAGVIRVKTGVTRDGLLMSQHMDFVFDSGAYGAFKPMGLLLGAQKAVGPYRIPHTLQEERMVYTNKVPCGHMRAPGYPQGVFASESQMDVVAGELGMDPVEFRRINLMRAGDESPFGKRVPHLEAARVLDRALQDSRYHGPKAVHTGRGVAMAQWFPLGGECYVFVTVDGDGGVTVAAAVVDQGSGVHTVLRQVAAEVLDVELEAVRVEIFDTRRVPADQGLGGSRGTRVYGCAAYEAAVEARRTLFERAAELMDAPVDRLSVSQGSVVRTDGAGRLGYGEIVRAIGSPVSAQGHYADTTTGPEASVCVQIVEVAVDPETGQVSLRKVTTAHDVGTIINPLLHQGQIEGGIVMAVGYGTMEEMAVEDGRITVAHLGDYKIPSVRDVPVLQTAILRSPHGSGPYQSMSIGETPVIPFAAALANAVADAVGIRVTSLPVTAERVFAGIHGSGEEGMSES